MYKVELNKEEIKLLKFVLYSSFSPKNKNFIIAHEIVCKLPKLGEI